MEVFSYQPGSFRAPSETVLALGFFDGVHLGHRALIALAAEKAKALGLPLGVFTFPSEDAMIKKSALRLYDTKKKLSLLSSLGVDCVFMCELSTIAAVSAEDFVRGCLVSDMRAAVTVCGFNYRFGNGAKGDCDALDRYMRALGRENITLPPMYHSDELLSSGAIRAHLSAGNVARAAEMLGAPYALSGVVESGDGRGKTLGFPTVNIPLEGNQLLLSPGVYATAAQTDAGVFPSVTNVGTCPTFGERSIHAETHLCDFQGNLYGANIELKFLAKLREEKRFSSGEELIKQINIDKNKATEVYKAWQEAGQN